MADTKAPISLGHVKTPLICAKAETSGHRSVAGPIGGEFGDPAFGDRPRMPYQERPQGILRCFDPDQAFAEGGHVGVVVPAGPSSAGDVVDKAARVSVTIQRNGDADAGAADGDPLCFGVVGHASASAFAVGVVDRLTVGGAEVGHAMTQLGCVLQQSAPQVQTGVVEQNSFILNPLGGGGSMPP